ncbi:MAG TPA: zf-HC2 domain-containing protein [Anaerolineales bacterium]|nr:zf-HC2 domain-containing protein [Anaerolineales bacterium]
MNRPPLNCKELVELVTEYLENALPPGERQRFEDHLQGCSGCRTYLEQMRQTIHLVGHLPEDEIPPDTQADLLMIFRNWHQGE